MRFEANISNVDISSYVCMICEGELIEFKVGPTEYDISIS